MRDTWKIVVGLLLFLFIMTFPVWFNAVSGRFNYVPDLEIATADIPGRDACVMPTEYMRAKHMDLLNDWRDKVVRKEQRVFTTADGRKFNMSLTRTCLDCHSNKDAFCDRCHYYDGVDPYCWNCHIVPEEGAR